jgi:hypothetical protein
MKGKAPAFQFYVRDWLSAPDLRMASCSTRGIWIDLLCFMWESRDRGEVEATREQFLKLTGSTEKEFQLFHDEARRLGFCDICVTNNGSITVKNRRMSREEKERRQNRERQRRHRDKGKSEKQGNGTNNGDVTHGGNGDVTPPSSSSSSSSNTFSDNSYELRLAKLLFNFIKKRNPNHKEPNFQTWAKQIDYMLRIDKRTFADVRRIIAWCQSDSFWQNNILSTKKLRDQFDQLTLKMKEKQKGHDASPSEFPLPEGMTCADCQNYVKCARGYTTGESVFCEVAKTESYFDAKKMT